MSAGFGLNQNAYGIGVDEGTAVCISNDQQSNAHVYGNGSVYLVTPKDQNNLPAVRNGLLTAPLDFQHLLVNRFDSQSGDFTFTSDWSVRAASYYIGVSSIDPFGRQWPNVQIWRDDQFVVTKDAYDRPLPPS